MRDGMFTARFGSMLLAFGGTPHASLLGGRTLVLRKGQERWVLVELWSDQTADLLTVH